MAKLCDFTVALTIFLLKRNLPKLSLSTILTNMENIYSETSLLSSPIRLPIMFHERNKLSITCTIVSTSPCLSGDEQRRNITKMEHSAKYRVNL